MNSSCSHLEKHDICDIYNSNLCFGNLNMEKMHFCLFIVKVIDQLNQK